MQYGLVRNGDGTDTITNVFLAIGLKENINATVGYRVTGGTLEEVMYGYPEDGVNQHFKRNDKNH